MTSAAYVAKRLRRLAAELAIELKRPTLKTGLISVQIEELEAAQVSLSNAAYMLDPLPFPETPAPVSEGVSDAMRFAFIAVGRDAAGRDIYAQDEAGTVWAGASFDGIARSHRFPTRADALAVAETRGGYAYPIPV